MAPWIRKPGAGGLDRRSTGTRSDRSRISCWFNSPCLLSAPPALSLPAWEKLWKEFRVRWITVPGGLGPDRHQVSPDQVGSVDQNRAALVHIIRLFFFRLFFLLNSVQVWAGRAPPSPSAGGTLGNGVHKSLSRSCTAPLCSKVKPRQSGRPSASWFVVGFFWIRNK